MASLIWLIWYAATTNNEVLNNDLKFGAFISVISQVSKFKIFKKFALMPPEVVFDYIFLGNCEDIEFMGSGKSSFNFGVNADAAGDG